MSPFRYRPANREGEPDEWADNWLSNFMAWMSQQPPFKPMCDTDTHMSSRVMEFFWTDCPCCLIWRGLITGYVLGGLLGLLIGITVGLLVS